QSLALSHRRHRSLIEGSHAMPRPCGGTGTAKTESAVVPGAPRGCRRNRQKPWKAMAVGFVSRVGRSYSGHKWRTTMRTAKTILAAGLLAAITALPAAAADISGAGATFPYPIYAKWGDAYKKETNVGINYQSIGSGGG